MFWYQVHRIDSCTPACMWRYLFYVPAGGSIFMHGGVVGLSSHTCMARVCVCVCVRVCVCALAVRSTRVSLLTHVLAVRVRHACISGT
jgi:hypothetical protein